MDREAFYDRNSDSSFACKDGGIRVNKEMLPQQNFTWKRIVDDGNVIQNVIKVQDYDVATFITFLDLIMGFTNLDSVDPLSVLGMAKKFGFDDLFESCVRKLKPSAMSEKVILTLNQSIDLDCEELTEAVTEFLASYDVQMVLIEDELCSLLTPKSVLHILKMIPGKNDFIVKKVAGWGMKYMDENQMEGDLRSFFQDQGILNKIPIRHLKSVETVLSLHDPKNKRSKLFEEGEILEHLKKIQKPVKHHEWLYCYSYTTFQERFTPLPSLLKDQTDRLEITIHLNPFFRNYKSVRKGNDAFECIITLEGDYYDKLATKKKSANEYSTFGKPPPTMSMQFGFNISFSEKGFLSCNRKILLPENSEKCSVNLIKIDYKFLGDCRILEAEPELSSSMTASTTGSPHEVSYFVPCDIAEPAIRNPNVIDSFKLKTFTKDITF